MCVSLPTTAQSAFTVAGLWSQMLWLSVIGSAGYMLMKIDVAVAKLPYG